MLTQYFLSLANKAELSTGTTEVRVSAELHAKAELPEAWSRAGAKTRTHPALCACTVGKAPELRAALPLISSA